MVLVRAMRRERKIRFDHLNSSIALLREFRKKENDAFDYF
jgi:hypothetical protein